MTIESAGRLFKKFMRKSVFPRARKKVGGLRGNSRSRATYLKHKEEARQLVHQRLQYFSTLTGVMHARVAIRDQRSRWGSCSLRGNLNFNYRILFLPPHLADYIIVHELCHIRHPHHGGSFWEMVETYVPNATKCRAELREWEKRFMHATGKPI